MEDLVVSGTADLTGTGNDLNSRITGNSGNNILDGGLGADEMRGGSGNDILDGGGSNDAMSGGQGNDTYFVDHAQDTTTESSGQGTDTVKSTLDCTDQRLTRAQVNAPFGGQPRSAATGEQPVGAGDELERSLLQFIDAMNHFGGEPAQVVDRFDSAGRELANEWLVVAAVGHEHSRSLTGRTRSLP